MSWQSVFQSDKSTYKISTKLNAPTSSIVPWRGKNGLIILYDKLITSAGKSCPSLAFDTAVPIFQIKFVFKTL